MKQTTVTKLEPKQTPDAVEALCNIVEIALAFRNDTRPTLTTVAKLASRGSGLLKLDTDVKVNVENSATVALAKKLNLVS